MAGHFRTKVPPISYPFRISHQQNILCYGSCFAEHMAGRLQDRKFKTRLNPFGITYHPLQIARGISGLLQGQALSHSDLFFHNERWQAFDFHSQFSHPDQEVSLRQMNQSLRETADFLQQVDLLIVTLGTAYGFIERKSGKLVNNCHKLPADHFERKRFDPDEMIPALEESFRTLKDQRSDLQVLLTVSPVRHIKDGMIENQRSKAALLLTAADLSERLDFVHYFPAFELVLDELRDYRFYKEDMIHPSELAIDYIWSYFQDAFFEVPTQQLVLQLEKIKRASLHRPFHPKTESHQAFLKTQLAKIQDLQMKFPALDFREEQEIFAKQLL